MASKFSA
jgi:hypothetical protein